MLMTAEIPGELLESLRWASASMADIRALAEKLGRLSPGQIEPVLQGLLDAGEDRALSRLLQVCAFDELKLDPKVLCACLGVCEDLLDLAPCFALQDESAIEPLLGAAAAEELPLERQSYAARLAAELTAKFNLDPQPVRKALWKLEQAARAPEIQLLLAQSLLILDEGATPGDARIPRWSELPLSAFLPEHSPRRIVGGDYTVRRPVAKLGRNDPCHCGSGKKYKKCCYAKDQDLRRDASPYAGTTRTDIKANPGLVDDPAVILNLRAHELKKLAPAALSDGQLPSGYQRALAFGLRELAFDMLVEWERRSKGQAFDQGHFEDLIEAVLQAGDLDLARRIRDHCGDQAWWQPDAIAFRFDLLENPERFGPLERHCREAVCPVAADETEFDEPLTRLAYDFAPRHPALAITFARAAIASNPDRHFDNAMLLDVIGDARVDLDLEPGGDPAEALFDWIEDRTQLKEKAHAENREIERLTAKLNETLAALEEKKQALRATEQALGTTGAQLEQARGSHPAGLQTFEAAASDSEKEATLRRLRDQVAGLKAEIGEQQTERRQLRKMLINERKKLAELSQPDAPAERPAAAEEAAVVAPAGRPILPEYTDAFRKRLATLAPPLAAKAILAAGRFAAHETAIWRQTKPLERLPEHYRIRLGLDYRMIVHWQPGKVLRILEVIPRQDLEAWIRRQS
jgi:hypothetical protein